MKRDRQAEILEKLAASRARALALVARAQRTVASTADLIRRSDRRAAVADIREVSQRMREVVEERGDLLRQLREARGSDE